jgi:gentisate 1,2-dioxygenase
MPAVREIDRDAALERFYVQLADAALQPLWTQHGLLPASPPIATVPYCWRWDELRRLAARAGELVTIDRGGDRRVLALSNPGLGGLPYATSSLWAAVQYLGPGESAPAHRHTPAAIRFVIEGGGVWTLVDGDPVQMRPGDLVLTPSWRWHEHHSAGDQPMCWFDGLDLPMVRALDAIFFEQGPNREVNRAVDPKSASEHTFGTAGLLADDARPGTHSPLVAYRWRDTDSYLSRAVERGDRVLVTARFTDPTTGLDALPTLRCAAHRIVPGERTPTTRRAGSSVWVTFEGRARAVVAGQAFDVGRGDMFAVPSWAPFDLEAEETTSFFSISDAPLLEALHLARTEQLPDPQPILDVSPADPSRSDARPTTPDEAVRR